MSKKLLGLDKVKDAIRKFKMLENEDGVLVGFSGGADSMYLLLALRELGFKVFALHINHGLRESAIRDESFCVDFCKKNGIEIFVERVKIGGERGIEKRAREIRYNIFKMYSKEKGLKVALGHNLTDAFETFVFNSLRGSGIRGLIIPPKVEIFVRPIIFLCRDEIREYLRDAGYTWVEDESNLSERFSRNRIRLRFEPILEEIFPNWCERFLNTYINLYEEREFFEEKLGEFAKENLKFAGGIFAIKISGKTEVLRILSDILKVEIKPLRQVFHLKNLGRFDISGWKLYRYNDYIIGIKKGLTLEDLNLKFVGEGVVKFRKGGEFVDGKRLKDLFYQRRIPGFLRDVYPLVEMGGRIVWVPFVFGEEVGRFDKLESDKDSLFDVLKFVGLL
mgnify:CR=1 FL=1